jgi:hypothetical protein
MRFDLKEQKIVEENRRQKDAQVDVRSFPSEGIKRLLSGGDRSIESGNEQKIHDKFR